MTKNILKTIILILILVLIPNLIYAAPPVQTVIGDSGLEIRVQEFDTLKQRQDFDFHIHLFSRESGLPIDETIGANCTFHLYNSLGQHLYVDTTTTYDNLYDIEFFIAGGNFSDSGYYYYIAQCFCIACGITDDIPDLGGFRAASFIVTKDGRSELMQDSRQKENLFILVMYLVGFIFLYTAIKVGNVVFWACAGGWFLLNGLTQHSFIYGWDMIVFFVVAAMGCAHQGWLDLEENKNRRKSIK